MSTSIYHSLTHPIKQPIVDTPFNIGMDSNGRISLKMYWLPYTNFIALTKAHLLCVPALSEKIKIRTWRSERVDTSDGFFVTLSARSANQTNSNHWDWFSVCLLHGALQTYHPFWLLNKYFTLLSFKTQNGKKSSQQKLKTQLHFDM